MLRRLTQAAIAIGLNVLLSLPAFGQASLMPNAKQTFVDGNGNPYAAGKVFMYVPNTTTKKNTWQNSGQTNLNVNPVILDAAGRATIFGIGSYRQVLQDANGVSVWDGVTTAPLTAAAPTPSGTGDFMPLGNVMLIAGFTPPTNYVMANGQALNRTTYADALVALTVNSSATCISGNTTVSGISSTGQIRIGAPVEASCLAAGTTVSTIAGPTSITVSAAATANGATTIRVFNYGNGNGSTTFNVPDLRGRVPAGGECFDGAACPSPSRLTTSFYGVSPNASGAVGGAQSVTIVQGNLPAINFVHSGTTLTNPTPSPITTSNLGTLNGKIITQSGADAIIGIGGGGAAISLTQNTQATSVNAQGTAASGGSSTPFSIIQPTITLNYAVKVLNGNLPTVGVLSLGGMAGDILCGSGLLCSNSTVSVTALTDIPLTQNHIFVGDASGVAVDVAMSGDCVIVAAGAITCTKTSGTNFGTMATQNANSVAITGGTITGMPSPSINSDVATKQYVDGLASGITILAPSGLATATVLPNTPTYSNGASGVGATLTAGSNTTLTVDGTAAPLATVVLVKDQTSAFQNGIYSVTTAGSGAAAWVLTRVTYFDVAAEMLKGSYTLITGGATNANKSYVLAATIVTVGTDAVTFNLFSSTSSQWVTTGLDIYYITGKVGVGTSVPTALLHVTGPVGSPVLKITETTGQSSTVGQSGGFFGINANRDVAAGTIFDSGLPTAYLYTQLTSGDSSIQFGTTPTNNASATERMRITKDGHLGLGTTTPVFDANTGGRFFAVNNPTAGQLSEFGVGGNGTTPGDYVGSMSFWNSSLGAAEKRVATISGKTGAATNSGSFEFRTVNAGSFVLNASMQPYGLTNIVGGFSVNADFQVGTDITSALNTALGTQSNVRLPCGIFLVSSAINFGLAGQTLSGCGREGTILQVTGAGAISYIVNVSSLASTGMYDLTIDGNNASGLTGGCAVATASPKTKWMRVGCIHTTTAANNAAGFAFVSTSNTAATSSRWSELRDCYLEDIQAINSSYNSHSILLQYADYSSVTGCTSVNIDNGVNTQASNWVVVANNTFVGNSSAASPTGFGGVRCSNGTIGAAITGNTVRDMARGIFLLGCTNTTITGNTITNTQLQSILISATTGNATPTQYNTVTGNTMQDTCLSNTCNYAIEFNSGGGGVQQGVVAIGNSYSRVSTPVSTAMIGISGGVSAGQNTCANNTASITVGTC